MRYKVITEHRFYESDIEDADTLSDAHRIAQNHIEHDIDMTIIYIVEVVDTMVKE